MHLAAACECPTVALFGPTPVSEYHPWQNTHCLLSPEKNLNSNKSSELQNKTGSILDLTKQDVIKSSYMLFNLSSKPKP
jgi:ADP-heptose:LPS heptosyltransferase